MADKTLVLVKFGSPLAPAQVAALDERFSGAGWRVDAVPREGQYEVEGAMDIASRYWQRDVVFINPSPLLMAHILMGQRNSHLGGASWLLHDDGGWKLIEIS